MSRYIDADWIVHELEWWRDKLAETYGENDEYVLCLGEVLMKLDNTPTADVREIVKGKWQDDREHNCYLCSVCGLPGLKSFDFCTNCGADMRGEA